MTMSSSVHKLYKKRAQAVERVSDGKIIMLGYPTCGKEKDGMVWAKLYIPSTLNTWKKLPRKYIWAYENGLVSGRLACISSKKLKY